MINWDKTRDVYGLDVPKYRKRVCVICDECGREGTKLIDRVADVIDGQLAWLCLSCHKRNNPRAYSVEEKQAISDRSRKNWANKEYRDKCIKGKKKRWADPKYRAHMVSMANELWNDDSYRSKTIEGMNTDKNKRKLSERSKKKWEDKEYKEKMISLFKERSILLWQDPEYRHKVIKTLNSDEVKTKLRAASHQMWLDDAYKKKMSDTSKERWQDPEFREKMLSILRERVEDPEYINRCSRNTSKLWKDPQYREKILAGMSERTKKLWKDPEYRKKMEDLWNDPEYREKMAQIRRSLPKVSSLQEILYSILDDLGVKYYREHNGQEDDLECKIGPYSFDCVIPRKGNDLLIEVQGEYWHNLGRPKTNDKSKASYIQNNFPHQYELKYIWEHEFLNKNKVVELLKYWLGITKTELMDFSFGDVEIKKCPAKDYRILLSKYHYLVTAGRGGIAYGAYLNDKLIAVCVFSSLPRQNLKFDNKDARELSRLCIHPKYQKKNFASWFVSRCIKALDFKYKFILSYCDTTFNHDGTVYRACNFVQDGTVRPDYWYVAEDGWVMHKKTLYNQAISQHMKEKEYAELHGYKKVYGSEKLRFVYER